MWSLACLLVAGAVSISATAAQTVEVPGLGHVAGYEEHGLHIFKGMPYAEPPVGPRRFAPPVPVESWGTSLDAPLNGTEFGASCFNAVQGGAAVVKGGQDEACLYVNVWSPALPSSGQRPRPVLVWLHGGGFLVGSSSQPIAAPPPETLTRAADTVFVSFNYRLGVNGFLAHRGQGLDHVVGGKDAPEQGQYGAGTAGLLDQRAAIHWTLKHIAAFGGDPRRVTLAGSSAGAISLCFHLTDPSIAPFINTAVMKSAFCSFPFPPLAKAFELGDALAQQAGCSRSQQVGEVLAKAGMSHAQLDAALHPWAPQAQGVGPPPSAGGTMLVPSSLVVPRVDAEPIEGGTAATLSTQEATVAAAKLYQEELQCLQSVDADALRRLIPTRRGLMWWEGAYWFPVVNGIDAATWPNQAFRAGAVPPNINIVMGTVEDEASLFFLLGMPLYLPASHVDDVMAATLGDGTAAAVKDWYARSGSTSGSLQLMPEPLEHHHPAVHPSAHAELAALPPVAFTQPDLPIAGDGAADIGARALSDMWHCAHRREVLELAHARAQAGDAGGLWVYHLSHPPSWIASSSLLGFLGALHGSDLSYMYHAQPERMNEGELSLSWVWMMTFRTLLHTGRPPSKAELLQTLEQHEAVLAGQAPPTAHDALWGLTPDDVPALGNASNLRALLHAFAWPGVAVPANSTVDGGEEDISHFSIPVLELVLEGRLPRPALFDPPVCAAIFDNLLHPVHRTTPFPPQLPEPALSYLINKVIARDAREYGMSIASVLALFLFAGLYAAWRRCCAAPAEKPKAE